MVYKSIKYFFNTLIENIYKKALLSWFIMRSIEALFPTNCFNLVLSFNYRRYTFLFCCAYYKTEIYTPAYMIHFNYACTGY